jgi:hypothetical protein
VRGVAFLPPERTEIMVFGLQGIRGAGLQGCNCTRGRVVMCREVTARNSFYDGPHPYRLYKPPDKGRLLYKTGKKNFLLKKFGIAGVGGKHDWGHLIRGPWLHRLVRRMCVAI